MKEKLEYKAEETDKGICIDMVLKDTAKRQVFQNLVKA